MFAEKFSKNSNLDDSCICLPVFPSRTNLKLHISVTPMMIKKVIMNLDLSKAPGPGCVPVVVLKNCEPERVACWFQCWENSAGFMTCLITMVLLMWTWISLVLSKNRLLRCWGWPSFLNWIGTLALSLLLKLPPRKLEL